MANSKPSVPLTAMPMNGMLSQGMPGMMGPMGGGMRPPMASKNLYKVAFVVKDGERKPFSPIVPCVNFAKVSIFSQLVEGNLQGTFNVYGLFSLEKLEETNNRSEIIKNATWSNQISEVISNFNNPFAFLFIEANFEDQEDGIVELNISLS